MYQQRDDDTEGSQRRGSPAISHRDGVDGPARYDEHNEANGHATFNRVQGNQYNIVFSNEEDRRLSGTSWGHRGQKAPANSLPIQEGTIVIGIAIGRRAFMSANGGVPGTWVIWIADMANSQGFPPTQKWFVEQVAPGEFTMTHVASRLPVVAHGGQLKLGQHGTAGDRFHIVQDPSEQIWRIQTVSDRRAISCGSDGVSVYGNYPVHGASVITTDPNFIDEVQKLIQTLVQCDI